MKAYFYCSYNLSPVGYQKIVMDTETGAQARSSIDVETVMTLFTHGGAKTALGYDGSVYYMVLKGLRVTKPEIPLDTPGQNWYINYALTGSREELPQICAAAYYGYTACSEFAEQLAGCLTPQNERASYAVDVSGWRAVMEKASARYQAFLESGAVDFSDAPCGLGLEQMQTALAVLRAQKITGLYEFALLEGDENYFFSSTGCTDRSQLRHYVKAHVEPPKAGSRTRYAEPRTSGDGKNIAPGLLLGGVAVFTVGYAVYQIGKSIGKASRRKERRRLGDIG